LLSLQQATKKSVNVFLGPAVLFMQMAR